MKRPLLTLALAATAIIAYAQTSTQPAPVTRSATANLLDAKGNVVGQATLTETTPGPVTVTVTVKDFKDLKPGEHGLHLHATGQCAPTFAAAGGHFNPTQRQHGFTNHAGHHAGDLPNIRTDDTGSGTLTVRTSLVTLGDGPTSLNDADGTAIVLHAGPDDYHTDPAGASGDRVACGVVTMTK